MRDRTVWPWLREFGRIERTLFTLEWFKNIDLQRRSNARLNRGEARNALARAIFFYRLGEMRDRSFESQSLSGLRPQSPRRRRHLVEHGVSRTCVRGVAP